MSDGMQRRHKDEEEVDFTHDAMIDTAAVAEYLRALADGFEAKVLRFSDRRGEMLLHPHGLVNFEVDSHRDGDRVRLEVQFEWKERESPTDERNGTLHIEARERPGKSGDNE
jgi:amphi-Trp domain-containing protein